jgi:hypothetical protein
LPVVVRTDAEKRVLGRRDRDLFEQPARPPGGLERLKPGDVVAGPVARVDTVTTRAGSRNGTAGLSVASTIPNIVVVTPRASPSDRTVTMTKPRLRRSERPARATSCREECMGSGRGSLEG